LFYILGKTWLNELAIDGGFQKISPGVFDKLGIVAFMDDAFA
jgi:hypothetical protein